MAERVDQQMAAQAEKVIGPLVTDPQLAPAHPYPDAPIPDAAALFRFGCCVRIR